MMWCRCRCAGPARRDTNKAKKREREKEANKQLTVSYGLSRMISSRSKGGERVKGRLLINKRKRKDAMFDVLYERKR